MEKNNKIPDSHGDVYSDHLIDSMAYGLKQIEWMEEATEIGREEFKKLSPVRMSFGIDFGSLPDHSVMFKEYIDKYV